MKTNFYHSASIEQFLSGEMLPVERETFEREAGANPELAAELKLSRTIDAALKMDDIIDLRKKLQAARLENTRTERDIPVIKMNFRKVWLAAASFILLATLGSTLYFSAPQGSPSDKLFKQYYSSENLINVTRDGDANIVEAIIKFQEKDYQLAAKLFSTILANDNNNMACWFYYGISCIETENYPQAEKAFNKIINDDQNLYVEHAQWYLGLSMLKNNQLESAMAQFKSIANNPDNIHQQDASHLLKKLN